MSNALSMRPTSDARSTATRRSPNANVTGGGPSV
jgi:hypothetical protein